jgi:hypothetical protein
VPQKLHGWMEQLVCDANPELLRTGDLDGVWGNLREARWYLGHMVDMLCNVVTGKATIPPKDSLPADCWAAPLVEVMECAVRSSLGHDHEGEQLLV